MIFAQMTNLLSKLNKMINTKLTNYSTMMKLNEVFIENLKDKGRIILNRPKDDNKLSMSIVNQIYPVLKQWQDTKSMVLIKATKCAGDNIFCAGSDLRCLVESELKGECYAKKFYQVCLTLNSLIANYKIPFVVLSNGLISGDGVGLIVHAEYSVITERSVFNLPQCSLGFFPNMGATYFLPRLNDELGKYLGLSGHSINGRDIQRINLATHFCPSSNIYALEKELENCNDQQEILFVLQQYEISDNGKFSLSTILKQIEYCFSAETVEEIMKRLSIDNSTWAQDTLRKLRYNSPTSLKITLEALNRGQKMSLKDCLNMEYNMTQVAIARKDLFEGVRANIIDKDMKPSWRPKTLEEVTSEQVQAFFPKSIVRAIIQ